MTTDLTTNIDCERAIATAAEATAASRLAIKVQEVRLYMKNSTWYDACGMLRQEFSGQYRGYYPTCGMGLMTEAVIAEVFDALAEATGDPRRALRRGAGVRHG